MDLAVLSDERVAEDQVNTKAQGEVATLRVLVDDRFRCDRVLLAIDRQNHGPKIVPYCTMELEKKNINYEMSAATFLTRTWRCSRRVYPGLRLRLRRQRQKFPRERACPKCPYP